MNEISNALFQLLDRDDRYQPEAYEFVRAALAYAHDVMELGQLAPEQLAALTQDDEIPAEAHVTGQELCEAIRQFSLLQFGFMAKTVMNSWGIHETMDYGEIVYNMIDAGLMKQSQTDVKTDFVDVYDFKTAFVNGYEIQIAGDCEI